MLKNYGNFYGNDKTDYEEIKKALENGGFTVAWNNETSGTILKDDPTLNEDNADEQ